MTRRRDIERNNICVKLRAAFADYKRAQIERIKAIDYSPDGAIIIVGDLERLCDRVDHTFYVYQERLRALKEHDAQNK